MWDERFSEPGHAYGTEPNDFLRERVGDLKRARCLCIAEGQGRNAVWLAGQGFDVTAMDQSPVGLQKARELAKDRGVSIATQVADLVDYDMGEGAWDSIVSVFCHLPPDLRRSVHARIVNALAPGGTLLLEAYTPDKYDYPGVGGPPRDQLERTFTRAMLLDDFKDLEIIHAAETVREVNEGKYHHGRSAVVQFLAKKPGE
ncbi:class I SAM-dependent methyltransferase [Novosphingobium malaysiense]|uniref:SAM-dependent methyltransferase n=1 Tax=Novosphingobium malaysiense TaxID=1348853 RepID=A0A0B1ZR31_9SPHN|nr:class I SAM-dependent methyltransferase [Novosphingobium malaysiense]KHK91744.1 SAM-dependent methyltransferase [Novosphingobium malaysiense]